MEAIEEEVVKRKINSAKAKAKKYDKKMKGMNESTVLWRTQNLSGVNGRESLFLLEGMVT